MCVPLGPRQGGRKLEQLREEDNRLNQRYMAWSTNRCESGMRGRREPGLGTGGLDVGKEAQVLELHLASQPVMKAAHRSIPLIVRVALDVR